MKLRLLRVITILLSFFFFTGFVPIFSFIGPGVTVLTSGNVYKASAQFIVNQRIEKETGKNSLTLIKETLVEEKEKKIKKNSFDDDLRNLVETRITMTRQKIENKKKPKATKANLKARAAKGSLLSIIGLVVIKAEDHKSTKMKGNILIIMFNKQINQLKSNKSVPIMSKLNVEMK